MSLGGQASASQQVRELVEARLKAMHDEATRIHDARQTGREEGREEGRQEGLEEGRQEGGKIALQETARRMLTKGFPTDTISQITGLSPEEISSLKEQN